MEYSSLTPDTTFPYRLFRFTHKRTLDSVSTSYFAVLSKDNNPVGLVLSIDIDEQWHHARSAATSFWQIFIREFNHSESRSTLVRFEEGLKELNKAVVRTQEKVKQPISVAAAIFENNQIHFSTIGTNRVLLVRDGKFSDVTSGSDKSGNQFAAVTSGDLSTNDSVILANQNLYEFVAAEPDELWQTSDADFLSKEILSRAQNNELALNCVLIQYDPDAPHQTTLYWEESEKRYPIALPKLPSVTLPKVALPKLPSNIKLPKINWPKFKKISWPAIAGVKIPKLKIKFSYLAIGLFIVLAIYGISAFNKNRTSSQKDQSADQPLVEKLSNVDKSTFINELLSAVESKAIDNLSPADIDALKQQAKTFDIEIVSAPNIVSELADNAVAIDSANNELLAVDETGQLWELNSKDQLKQIDHQFKIINPTGLVAFSNKSILITDELGNLWQYSGSSKGPTALSLPKPLADGQKLIGKFLTNLYIYSYQQNAVYRQANFQKSIDNSSPYFGLTALGKNKPIDWGINGEFIFLTANNKITGLLRNEITLPSTSVASSSTNGLIATNGKTIFIANQYLLSSYSSAGKLKSQQIIFSSKPISAITATDNQLLMALGKKIVREKL